MLQMKTKFSAFYNKVTNGFSKTVSPLCAATIALAAVMMPANAATVIGGTEWEYAFYGDQIPILGDSSWTNFTGSATPYPSYDGNNIVINTSADLDYQAYYTSTVWNPGTSGKAAFEFRLRLVSVTPDSALGSTIAFQVGTGGGGLLFYLGENGITLIPGSGTPSVTGFDPFETNTYRVIIDLDANTFSLDINGTRQLSDTSLDASFAGKVLRFGDLSSGSSGRVEYEYVAFNNASAPIPEPKTAALLLLTVGGVVVLFDESRSRSLASVTAR